MTPAWPHPRGRPGLALALAALLAAMGALAVAAVLRESQWQRQVQGQAAQALQQAWRAAAAPVHDALSARLDALSARPAAAPSLADDAAGGLAQLDLYDPAGVLRSSRGAGPDALPLVDAASLQALAQDAPGPAAQRLGVRLREAGREGAAGPALLVLARRLDDGWVLAAGADLRPLLRTLEQQRGTPVSLHSPRGLLLLGLPPPGSRLTLPLPGLQAVNRPAVAAPRPAALLLAPGPAAGAPPTGLAPWVALAAVPLLIALALWHAWRRQVAPLLGPVRLVEAWAENPTNADGADGADEEATLLAATAAGGDAARLARAASRLRAELRALEALRDERQRVARQQARLLRQPLRTLAATLGRDSRDDILAQLADEGTGDGGPQLARLASLLDRLTALVGRQHGRLLQLLRELQDSVRTREHLASLQQELDIARRIQRAILPRRPPPVPGLVLQATMEPAREVGGDFYDWFLLDEHRLAVAVADVSGKGVPAAFFMAVARTLLRTTARYVTEPAAVLARLNDELAADNDETLFVTLFYAVLDLRSGRLECVNAGHNPPLLRRADGTVQALARGRNPLLAVWPGQRFQADSCTLAPGDGLLLYTDGLTEAQTGEGRLFGEAALVAALAAAPMPGGSGLDAAGPVQAVVSAVRAFEAGAPQADDITCIWLQRLPAGEHPAADPPRRE